MNPELLRNIGILAHIDAGKTTVSERFLFYSGVERRMGEVHEGTAVMDWMQEERERGITISAAVTACPWRGQRIQLIDTPGHVDFSAEVARSLRVLDGAIVVVDAVAGPQAQTETVVRQARRRQLPLLLFINKMDRPGADFARTVAQAAQRLHVGVIVLQLPWGEGREFAGVIDLVQMKLLTWSPDDFGKTMAAQEIPADDLPKATAARMDLCSQLAAQREDWADHFLQHDDLPDPIVQEALRIGSHEQSLVPVLCGAALRNCGIQPLMDAVLDYLPSPLSCSPAEAVCVDAAKAIKLIPDPDAPLAAFCFKVLHEDQADLVFLRLFAGTLTAGDTLLNVRTGQREKLQTLYAMHADHREKLEVVGPGSFIAVPGLTRVQTGDSLCAEERQLLLAPIDFPEPVLTQALESRDAADQESLARALLILAREDPTLHIAQDEDTGGFFLAGMGELHLEVALHRLQRDFKLQLRAGTPRVSFCESLSKECAVDAEMVIPDCEGQAVKVFLRLQPQAEEILRFECAPSCPELPSAMLQSIESSEFLHGWIGALGYPIVRLRVVLESWTTASGNAPSAELLLGALQKAVASAFADAPLLLAPRMKLEVRVPEVFLSGVLADLQRRRAVICEVEAEVDTEWRTVRAEVSMAEVASYSTDLRSLSQGKADFQLIPDGLVEHVER